MATINPWKQFSELLPKPARLIGRVSSLNSHGTSTVVLRDGSAIMAKGQGSATGQKVLVENGEISREVPDLPVFNITV